MGKNKKIVIGISVIVLLLVVFFVYRSSTGQVVKDGTYDDFARYLTESGVKMYGTEWCPHCQNQKKLFGNSFRYINYVDCDKKRDECLIAGVGGYPTWKIDGQNYPGEQSIETLKRISGYAK